MSKETNRSKEPLKSFISKVGTFRGKKHGQNSSRPSSSDLKFGDSMMGDESMFRVNSHDETGYPTFGGQNSDGGANDLDSTKLSGGSSNGTRDSYRY